ncbi:hypothetical protein GGI07_001121 [Coemansia sp. Benny D115]|nr:hypothetical protein GGI07_001121 [Coemansia sp. Benny D115]
MRVTVFNLSVLVSAVAAVAAALSSGSSPATAERRSTFYERALRDFTGVPRIVGGTPAPAQEYRFITYIETYSILYGAYTCTGSLIAPNVVLTAAHCTFANSFTRHAAEDFQVGFTHKTPDPMVAYKGYSVAKVIAHPKFTMASLKNDIAVLILNDTIPDTVASKVKVYVGEYYLDTPIQAAGFGMTDPSDHFSLPESLMKVDLHVGPTKLCSKNSGIFDHDYMICTDGTPGKDTCNGDSGGPLTTSVDNGSDRLALIGLTSFGSVVPDDPNGSCAMAGASGFYTRVGSYIDWISGVSGLNIKSFTVTNKTKHAEEVQSDSDLDEASNSDSDSDSGSGSGSGSDGLSGDDEDESSDEDSDDHSRSRSRSSPSDSSSGSSSTRGSAAVAASLSSGLAVAGVLASAFCSLF